MTFTHFDKQGNAKMVDVGRKTSTERYAIAYGSIKIKPSTLKLLKEGLLPKGDVLTVAKIAGILAAKKTSDLIPMCHSLNVCGVDVNFKINSKQSKIEITSKVKLTGQTGVEMEALTVVSIAALTIYDMCKVVDKEMIIGDIMLLEKKGGKSGHFKKRMVTFL